MTAYDAGDYAKAYKIWSSIDDDDIAAMRNVAMMRRQGLGTDKDPKGAELMYTRAAEAGLPTAQADLADMLIKGEAGPPDPERRRCPCWRPLPPPIILWPNMSWRNSTRLAGWCPGT